jgi:Na+/melibiose symporter-like transporter
MGFGAGAIGVIFLLIRLWDVFVDPVLGLASDRFPTRWGRRRHWIVLSVPIMMLSTYMIFLPERGVGSTYLVFWMLVLYVGWSLLTLSHVAWGAELADDYHERSRIQSWRQAVLVAGLVLVLLMPVMAQRLHPEDPEPAKIAAMGLFVIVTLPLAVIWTLLQVRERAAPPRPHVALGKAFGVLLRNRPLQILLAVDLISGISGGIVASMFLDLTRDVLQLGQLGSSLLLVYFISGIVCVAPILRLSRSLGKHRTAVVSALWTVCFLPVVWILPPASPGFAVLVFILLGVNYAAGPFLYYSIMADVADHDTVETGQARTGLFYSLLTMTNKLGQAIAIWIAYALLPGLFGFHFGVSGDAAAIDGFKLAYIVPSAAIALISAILLWFFPIDEKKQRANRAILEQRALAAVATAIEVTTGEPGGVEDVRAIAD